MVHRQAVSSCEPVDSQVAIDTFWKSSRKRRKRFEKEKTHLITTNLICQHGAVFAGQQIESRELIVGQSSWVINDHPYTMRRTKPRNKSIRYARDKQVMSFHEDAALFQLRSLDGVEQKIFGSFDIAKTKVEEPPSV